MHRGFAFAGFLSALVLAAGLFIAPAAKAALITWDMSNVVLGDASTTWPVSGYFTFNTTTNQVVSAYFTVPDYFSPSLTGYFDTSAGATVSNSSISGFQVAQSTAERSADSNGAHTLYIRVDTTAYPAGLGDLSDASLPVSSTSAVATNGCCYTGALAGSELLNAAAQIPEPASLALLGAGAVALGCARRRRAA